MSKVRTLLIPLALGIAVLASGCSSSTNAPASLYGTVTYKGQAVKAGSVTVYPAEGGQYQASISDSGSFRVADIPVGEAVVTVETDSVKPDQKVPTYGQAQGQKGPAQGQQPPAGYPAGPTNTYVAVPKRYGDKKTTPLKLTLKKGDQKFDIEMTE